MAVINYSWDKEIIRMVQKVCSYPDFFENAKISIYNKILTRLTRTNQRLAELMPEYRLKGINVHFPYEAYDVTIYYLYSSLNVDTAA
jgi:hypothetical protein